MSDAGMVIPKVAASTASTDPYVVNALGEAAAVPANLNSTAASPQAYATALGNNQDVISVNDPLALANFLPGPPPAQIIQVPTTPTWVYAVGGVLALFLFSKKGIL